MDGWPPATSRMAKCLLKELGEVLYPRRLPQKIYPYIYIIKIASQLSQQCSQVAGVLLNPVPEPWQNWEVGHLIRNFTMYRVFYVWQSRVEIKSYSIACFDRIAAFEAPYHNFCQGWGSYALHSFIKYSCIYEAHISPTLNRSSVIWSFKHSNAIENTQWNNL